MDNPEFTIKAEPFSWDDNFSEVALEDFSRIQVAPLVGAWIEIAMSENMITGR